jgi:glucose-1-phosphate thymidylyltransferase
MKSIILAAGYATRLYPLTKDRPKPLLQVGDKTIIDYLLVNLSEIPEIDVVYIVTNAKFAPVFHRWADRTNRSGRYPHLHVEVIDDGTTSNESRLGAIADLQYVFSGKKVEQDVLITAGDNIFTFDFAQLYRFFVEKGTDIIVAHLLDDFVKLRRSGVVEIDDRQKVVGFEEKPNRPKSKYICPALYILKKETLPLFDKYLSDDHNPDAPGHFISWLHHRVPIHAYIMREIYHDIGTLESYRAVCAQFSR